MRIFLGVTESGKIVTLPHSSKESLNEFLRMNTNGTVKAIEFVSVDEIESLGKGNLTNKPENEKHESINLD